ncbi:MAG: polysaccharide deacetylase family protein [Clostridia bacterium]|nr:polysaccharide deacetylase family protein [Clostridia bacterium]
MFNGKKKALTFSYDDGVTQDIRLIEILNRYGLKATFNINSDLLGQPGIQRVGDRITVTHNKVKARDVRYIYEGHEVAVHTLTHPNLTQIPDDREVIRQVEKDRLQLSELCGYNVIGMAYPCGGINNDDRTAALIRNETGVKYARALESNGRFALQHNLYRFRSTVYHLNRDDMMRLAQHFLAADPTDPMIFYIWGHSYEFDMFDAWGWFEDFCRLVSGREDVFYGTNKEILL